MRGCSAWVAACPAWATLAGCGAAPLHAPAGRTPAPDGGSTGAAGATNAAPDDGTPPAADAAAPDVEGADASASDATSNDALRIDAPGVEPPALLDAASDSADGAPLGPGPYRALAIAVGLTHTCVLLDDHGVKCWGDGASGQLGYGDTRSRGNPSDMGDALPKVDLGTDRTARALSAGRYNTCALLDDGSAKCWGIGGISGQPAQLGDEPGEMGDALPAMPVPAGRAVTRVASGVDWASAILDDGSGVTWRLGATTVFPPAATPVVQLVHGSETSGTIALFADGQDGVLDPTAGLVERGFTFNKPSTYLASSRQGSCAVLTNGGASCTDLGGGTWSNAPLVTRIATGMEFSCVLSKDGGVRCQGNGLGGCEPGKPQNSYWCETAPAVALGQPALDVQAGDSFACALLSDGTVRCWGGQDDCVPYDRNGVMGYDCLGPAMPPTTLGGGVALVMVDGKTSYGPWRAVDLGTRR